MIRPDPTNHRKENG